MRQTAERLIQLINSLPLEILQKIPQLEQALPELYKLIQIEDVCDHKFVNNSCAGCGISYKTL
jgi:hypothetical protein